MCATRQKLWLAPDSRQGRMASLSSQHTQEPPWWWVPSVALWKKHWSPRTCELLNCMRRGVRLYRLVVSFITDIAGGGKRNFGHTSPSSQSGDMKSRLRWNSEIIWADTQDPNGEAISQIWFLYTWYFIHTISFQMEGELGLLYNVFKCAI